MLGASMFLSVIALLLTNMASAVALPLCNGNYHDPCFGVYMWSDGVKYVGDIRRNKKHGNGITNWPDGAKYAGEYRDGNKHGQGIFTFPDGAKYVGEYKDGDKHGQGTMFWADGGVWVGQWRDDEWVSGDQYTEGEAPPNVMTLFNKD